MANLVGKSTTASKSFRGNKVEILSKSITLNLSFENFN
jgi:hypothetical protein